MNLAANFQSQDFVVGLTTILNMEFDPSKIDDNFYEVEVLKKHLGEDWPKVMVVLTTWESIGVLVHRGKWISTLFMTSFRVFCKDL